MTAIPYSRKESASESVRKRERRISLEVDELYVCRCFRLLLLGWSGTATGTTGGRQLLGGLLVLFLAAAAGRRDLGLLLGGLLLLALLVGDLARHNVLDDVDDEVDLLQIVHRQPAEVVADCELGGDVQTTGGRRDAGYG
uniref:Uncharacterized protein n=1 Tax=Anopheles farauti TaxID=69004 RepID=A0A182QPD7_9DIPT